MVASSIRLKTMGLSLATGLTIKDWLPVNSLLGRK